MKFKGQHILSTGQFSKEDLIGLFEEAREMEVVFKKGGSDLLAGKVMATLFFEPSTRTRFSFEIAMQRLGGKVVSNPDMMNNSSITKLETLEDTGKIVSQMVDVIVMRHPEPGAVAKLANGSDVPVFNAGDGPNQHPTQGLLDLYTIWKNFGRLDGLTIGLIGDLKNSRVQHSQCGLLRHFDVNYVLVSPENLSMPQDILDEMNADGKKYLVNGNFEEAIGNMDVISMSRVQKERFANADEYKRYAGLYILDAELMKSAKEKSIVIQPFPRVDEVAISVDNDPRAKYFEQVRNGVVVRMALLKMVLAG